MLTVFIILSLVVLSANLMIKLLNKYGPVPVQKGNPKSVQNQSIHPRTVAILSAVVTHVTGGKGEISQIEKSA